MKRYISIFIIMLCLLGCQQAAPVPSTEPTVKASSDSPIDITQGGPAPPSFETIADYEKYIASKKTHDKEFIHYETISLCGDFYGFSDSGKYSAVQGYTYYIIDSQNFTFGLSIIYGDSIGLDMGTLETEDNPADLRFHGNDNGYYYIGAIRYAYYEGKLYNIRWNVDNKTILIQAAGGQIHTYPIGGDTFMNRLLNAQTAEAAVDEFNAKVAAARAEKAD